LVQILLSKYAIERWFNIPSHLFIVRTLPWETLTSKNHEFKQKLQTSVMVSIAVSKVGMTELIFFIPGTKANGQYYRDVLLSQQMLPAIKHVASNTFVFQQDNAPSHRTRTSLNSYSK